MTSMIPQLCNSCVHVDRTDNRSKCPAYPNGIPDDILFDLAPHFLVRADQTGNTVFEPLPGQESADMFDWWKELAAENVTE